MACHLPPFTRDLLVRLFREEVYRRCNFVEFPPQAAFRLATEGWELTTQVVEAPSEEPRTVDLSDLDSIKPSLTPELFKVRPKPVKLLVPSLPWEEGAFQIGANDNYARVQWQLAVPRRHTYTMRDGSVEVREGVIAHNASMLASFKNGKSMGVGMWATGFACIPGATIDMVGLEYATSEPEFTYLTEALMSGTKPFITKDRIEHYHSSVPNGRLVLDLSNKCSFQVRSWKNKDTLRGGQISVYMFNEVYQLPGLEVYTGHEQNLRVEQGFATFTSTPDRPWVKALHKLGHGKNPDWFCVCDNNSMVNPISFKLTSFMRDLPDFETLEQFAPALLPMAQASGIEPGKLMSREKFMISWLGQMGGFVGRVYQFSKEAMTCYPHTHPHIFKGAAVTAWEQRQYELEQLQGAYLPS